jgi:hypothetical protein
MRALLIAGALGLLALTLGAAASGDPYRDQADTVPCPAAPHGWFNPPADKGGRTVLTPLSVLTAPDGVDEYSAAPVVQIDCVYQTASGKSLEVSVRYALPIDLNPWNDFYIGCTSTHHPAAVSTAPEAWNTKQRIYRVEGAKSWSLATFIDNLSQLEPADVPKFEAMTDTMLKDVQHLAHNCSLAGNHKPVAIQGLWTFDFDVNATKTGVTSSARTNGSFITTATTNGNPTGTISNLTAANFRVRIRSHGKASAITLHVGAPIGFSHSYGSVLRAQVLVLGSTVPGCKPGTTGSLAISAPFMSTPAVALSVCGQTYLNGKGTVRASIKSV